MLDLGIDGWKVDGTDPYILDVLGAHGNAGAVSRKEYSDHYYQDFFDYTRGRLGDDRLIMSRPVDGLGRACGQSLFLFWTPWDPIKLSL